MTPPKSFGQLSPVFRAWARPWQRLLWNVKLRGFDKLPQRGPAILAPNHLSEIDSMMLMLSVDRDITFVGKAEYMEDWPNRWLLPALGMIPIDRSGGDAAEKALDQAARVLEGGELFAIYPEGTRTRDGCLHRGRTGAARLALRTGAPLFPVGIRGTERIQPVGAQMPRPFMSCSITVGPPINIERHVAHTPAHLRLRSITDELMYEISRLSRQTYVDRYGRSTGRPTDKPPSTAPSGRRSATLSEAEDSADRGVSTAEDPGGVSPNPAEPRSGAASDCRAEARGCAKRAEALEWLIAAGAADKCRRQPAPS